MSDPYTGYADAINQQFIKPFEAIVKACGKGQAGKLLPCLPNIYRRWYYSALVENTYLTPANLFESLNRQYGRLPNLSPNVRLKPEAKYAGVDFLYQEYSKNNHPVVGDFRRIIEFCQPDIALTETNELPDNLALEASKLLHMCDPFYASFLAGIALEMGFLVKIPSIHANRYQLVRGTETQVAEISDDEMFDKIVQATLSHASKSLSDIVPTPGLLFDEEYVTGILKEPIETDFIFQRLFDNVGADMDMDELDDLDIFEEMEMLDMAVIQGTFLMGVFLDKYFLTPFGHYLKLIRPVYMLPFDFKNEISVFLEATADDNDDEVGLAFYAPCSRYYLTELGLEYFNVKPNHANYLDIENKLLFSDISALFEKTPAKMSDIQHIRAISEAFEQEHRIYSIKVKYLSEPRLWLNIDVSDITNLHRLFLELAYYFDLDKNAEYTFYPDEAENPFMAYASPNQLRRTKKASEATLEELSPEAGQNMVLAVSYPRISGSKHKERWSMEVTRVNQGKTGQLYPVVTRLGKGLKEYFEWQ
ncbi:MAG: hypothetical protein FWD03_07260 [Defluviitaleaceae bacterium]|nr:hypothetical protein [Defluviitaleaceae bacterium]